MSRTIALHVDGGPAVGLGHAARGLGLAAALAARGWRPSFLIDERSSLGPYIEAHGGRWVACPPTTSALAEACQRLGSEALVVDSYRVDAATLSGLRARLRLVVRFDDVGRHDLPADLVVNGSPAAQALGYPAGGPTRYLLGPAYQVLRPEFAVTTPRAYRASPVSLLVTVGGADPTGVLDDLLAALVAREPPPAPGAHVDVIVGPFGRPPRPDPRARDLRVHRAPHDLRSLMIDADVAVSGGGQTLYELARCGTPTVACCLGEDQRPNVEALARLGVVVAAGRAGEAGWLDRVATAVALLWGDARGRSALGRRAATVVDGRGADRVADAIESSLDGPPVAPLPADAGTLGGGPGGRIMPDGMDGTC